MDSRLDLPLDRAAFMASHPLGAVNAALVLRGLDPAIAHPDPYAARLLPATTFAGYGSPYGSHLPYTFPYWPLADHMDLRTYPYSHLDRLAQIDRELLLSSRGTPHSLDAYTRASMGYYNPLLTDPNTLHPEYTRTHTDRTKDRVYDKIPTAYSAASEIGESSSSTRYSHGGSDDMTGDSSKTHTAHGSTEHASTTVPVVSAASGSSNNSHKICLISPKCDREKSRITSGDSELSERQKRHKSRHESKKRKAEHKTATKDSSVILDISGGNAPTSAASLSDNVCMRIDTVGNKGSVSEHESHLSPLPQKSLKSCDNSSALSDVIVINGTDRASRVSGTCQSNSAKRVEGTDTRSRNIGINIAADVAPSSADSGKCNHSDRSTDVISTGKCKGDNRDVDTVHDRVICIDGNDNIIVDSLQTNQSNSGKSVAKNDNCDNDINAKNSGIRKSKKKSKHKKYKHRDIEKNTLLEKMNLYAQNNKSSNISEETQKFGADNILKTGTFDVNYKMSDTLTVIVSSPDIPHTTSAQCHTLTQSSTHPIWTSAFKPVKKLSAKGGNCGMSPVTSPKMSSSCVISSVASPKMLSPTVITVPSCHTSPHVLPLSCTASAILKKLMAIAKKRGFEVVQAWERAIAHQLYWIAASSNGDGELMLAKWLSLLNHICNVHSHDSDLFPQCQHGDIDEERDWITKDSRQYRAIEKIVRAKLLCTDIKKLSPDVQTYSLEVFHSVLNGFAPKSTHYFYDSMLARTLIAALHFNENGKKEQALTSTGDPRWAIAYPKQFKGQKAVAKTVKAKSTYEYVDRLMEQLFVLRELYPSYPLAKAHKKERCDQAPPPLTSKYVEAVKSDVVSTRVSRFSHI